MVDGGSNLLSSTGGRKKFHSPTIIIFGILFQYTSILYEYILYTHIETIGNSCCHACQTAFHSAHKAIHIFFHRFFFVVVVSLVPWTKHMQTFQYNKFRWFRVPPPKYGKYQIQRYGSIWDFHGFHGFHRLGERMPWICYQIQILTWIWWSRQLYW